MKTMTCKKVLMAGAACAALFMTAQSQAQNVGVSVQFGQPGFYGQVDVGNFPQPQVIYREPRVVERVRVVQPPMYLVVPTVHRNNWSRYCYSYHACGRPVYFVQENWYNTQVVPRYRDGYYRDHSYRHDAYRRDEYWRDDRRDRRYDEHDRHGHERGREHPEH
ncbi:hypothetical protein UNDKW_3426 [Undibacterium sp. KW1]|uniref:hypothetical protein n=1 Tax=Undibacterium sp. KW1 TaxID=2058624 RepID=UPI001331CF0A|nr:hypothetical protein [Undibacterium sp. KW1]BBB61699.1 hypothetical protein UNDKW_3426 [Undibacterium sp. KW1]